MACSPTQPLRRAVGEALGDAVVGLDPMTGGAGGHAFAARLASGARVFVKASDNAARGMFAAEARGLRWLADANAVEVPEVLAVRDTAPAFIVEGFVDSGHAAADFDVRLGTALAELHRAAPTHFGLPQDNFIGPLGQDNAPTEPDAFATFYADRRLRPLTQQLRERGALSAADETRLEALAVDLPNRIPEEPPARLHGDLWSGNVLVGAAGHPVLIDPAVYGGHREIDLAMMRLFGGFSARAFEAYAHAFPLCPGAQGRVPLMQLYPLLVHVTLFGGAYLGQLRAAIDAVD